MGCLPRRKAFLASLSLFFFLALLLGWFFFNPPSQTSESKIVYIKKGLSLRKISEILEREGVVRNAFFFSAITTILGQKARIKAGEYEFHPRMLPHQVLTTLVKGQFRRHLVTLVEGHTLLQIAQKLEEAGIVESRLFLEKATSPAVISSLGLAESAGTSLEGYLFPETYHLYKEMDPVSVLQIMVQQFKKVFPPDWSSKAGELGISEREAVILASIIEKETSVPEEKPLVSGVFHNRLRKRIPLQSDPTVIYGLSKFDGNLTREHLAAASPYNTYLVPGLPPTPICNPGRESLLAAVNPAPVSYLYFVSRNDGTHIFSSNLEDHNRAVGRYQKAPRDNISRQMRK